MGFYRDHGIAGNPSAGFESIAFPGAVSTAAYGNNNRDDIVGYFYAEPDATILHSFIALSVPEPASYALMLAGITTMLLGLSRQTKQQQKQTKA